MNLPGFDKGSINMMPLYGIGSLRKMPKSSQLDRLADKALDEYRKGSCKEL
jgi:hypothetical protein